MRRMLLLTLLLSWSVLSACDATPPVDRDELFRSVVEAVPDYQGFLTVDELHQSILDVAKEHPDLVSVETIGRSAGGRPVRLLEYEKDHRGAELPEALQEVLDESRAEFELQAAEADETLDYEVIPIRKLASIQLATALWAMDYVQTSPELRAKE